MAGELLIPVVLVGLILLVLLLADKRHFKKLVKNYNPDDDRSRKGGPKELTRGREPIVEKAKPNSPGLDKSEGGRVLPTAETLIDGEASSSSGEDDVVSEFLEGLEEERE